MGPAALELNSRSTDIVRKQTVLTQFSETNETTNLDERKQYKNNTANRMP